VSGLSSPSGADFHELEDWIAAEAAVDSRRQEMQAALAEEKAIRRAGQPDR